MGALSNYAVSGVTDGESKLSLSLSLSLSPFSSDHCVPVDRYTRFDAYVKRRRGTRASRSIHPESLDSSRSTKRNT